MCYVFDPRSPGGGDDSVVKIGWARRGAEPEEPKGSK